MRHTFGRTALVLSGGGALGTFHLVRFLPAHTSALLGHSRHVVLSPLLSSHALPEHWVGFEFEIHFGTLVNWPTAH